MHHVEPLNDIGEDLRLLSTNIKTPPPDLSERSLRYIENCPLGSNKPLVTCRLSYVSVKQKS